MEQLTDLRFSDDGNGVFWPQKVAERVILFRVRDIRHDRTGMHAMVGITLDSAMLAYNTFNITRDDDRGKLSRSAHEMLPELMKAVYPKDRMKNHLDLLCLWVVANWEESRYQITEFDPSAPIPQLSFPLKPYILDGGGTVMFAPPGGGKSYMTHTMAICISRGINGLFNIAGPRPCLYINLERSSRSMEIRERMIANALQLKGPTGLKYIHARGAGLTEVAKRVRSFTKRNYDAVLFLDSVSRIGLGKLIDDDTANKFIDIMNGFDRGWFGIGHPPRGDKGHTFGSVHFDAGQDIGIRMHSERQGHTRAIALEVVKANDIAFPPIAYYAFEFAPEEEGGGLRCVRKAEEAEFPTLTKADALRASKTIMDVIAEHVEANGPMTIEALAKVTNEDAGAIRAKVYSPLGKDMFETSRSRPVHVSLRV